MHMRYTPETSALGLSVNCFISQLLAGVPPQPVNFSSYLNGESVRNTDIVNWVTVGAYDVPTSESAPVTAVTGRQLTFWLQPYNYFDRVRGTPSVCTPTPFFAYPFDDSCIVLHIDPELCIGVAIP